MKDFERKDAKKREALRKGEITKDEYKQWRVGQIAIGGRWKDMKEVLAKDYHNANMIAKSIVNGYMPQVYALNHNYATFTVEQMSGLDTAYTLYDRATVERLMRDNPDMLPPPGAATSARIAAGKDIRWNKQLIQSSMMQSLLQGESIDKVAKRLAKAVGDKNYNSAVRNARTMATGAENAGRVDSYRRAQNMGIDLKQQWIATLDGRTRDSHREIDGETIKVGGIFSNGCRYPGDPQGPGAEVYNCRCTLVAQLKGFETDHKDMSLRNTRKLGDMTYEEWKNQHKKQEEQAEEQEKTSERYFKGTGIDPEEATSAFRDWADGLAYDIRFAQQNGYKSAEAAFIEKCIKNSNEHYTGPLYRGIMADRKTVDRYYAILDAVENGDEVDFELENAMGTSSWSTSLDIAKVFSHNANKIGGLDFEEGDYTPIVYRVFAQKGNKTALDIDEFAGLGQKEVIVSKDTQFALSHIDISDDGTIYIDYEWWED